MSHRPTATKKGTTLSNYVWHLKDHNINYNLEWFVVTMGTDYNPATGICRVCLLEKFFIMFKPEGASLNQRSEFFTHCRHYAKFLLVPPPPKKRKRRNAPNRWKWKFTEIYSLHIFIYLFKFMFSQFRFFLVQLWWIYYACYAQILQLLCCWRLSCNSDMKQTVQYISSSNLV